MKRVDTFGFFTLAAAGVPLRQAWLVRGRRLSPFSGSLVRHNARRNLILFFWAGALGSAS
jgi:hypothetical protein